MDLRYGLTYEQLENRFFTMSLDIGRETWLDFILQVEVHRVQLAICPKVMLQYFARLLLSKARKELDAVRQIRDFPRSEVTAESNHLMWEDLIDFSHFHLMGVIYADDDGSS